MADVTSVDFTNSLAYVEGSLNTFIYTVSTGSDVYNTGGILLNLPKGYVAIGGVASVSVPSADLTFASVHVSSGVATLFCYGADYAEADGHAVVATVVVKAKKG